MKSLSRSSGRSAVAAAAYRSGERLANLSDGQVHDYRGKCGIGHTEIVMPEGVDAAWALDRSALWNAAEKAEKRKDARVATEFEVALPHELTPKERIELARSFSQDLANRYGTAVDFAIHSPSGETDIRNHHAHILMTTREVTADGLGDKTQFEWRNARLLAEGLPTSHMQLRDLRQAWEHHANAHLARAGHAERIDHRSHEARGLEIAPTQHMGVHATEMQRRGMDVSRVRLEEDAARQNVQSIREKPEQVLHLVTGEKSVFDRHDVARALHRAIDDPQEFQNAFAQVMASAELVELRGEVQDRQGHATELARYSTREMIALEAGMVDRAVRMAESGGHGVEADHVERAFAARSWLAEEQREAVRHVTGEERCAAVVGLAGAGKSTMLTSAREAWEAQGYRVHGAALAGKAAEGLEESSGIASRTLASWEYGWANGRGQLDPGDVFVIDEAGMVSSRQLARFIEETDRAGAKLVLVGDPQQLQPIQAGAAFRAVTEHIGFAELEEVRRQREGWQREASHDFARLRVSQGLSAYDGHGAIRFAETREAARYAIVSEVMRDHDAKPEASQLVLTYRRADVRELNEAIRGERRERGELNVERSYRTNDGERVFAIGDRFLFLENSRDLGVKNGMLGTVGAVREGEIVVRLDGAQGPGGETEKGRIVTVPVAEYDKFDHGYATTIHKSQGATVDRSYVLASGGMDSHLAYVAMTRHRDAVQLHVGRDDFADRQALVTGLSHANSKETTLDYAERRGIEVEGRRDERSDRDERAERLLGDEAKAIRVPDETEPQAAKESITARVLREIREARDRWTAPREAPEPKPTFERASVTIRLDHLMPPASAREERPVEERTGPHPERNETIDRDRERGCSAERDAEREEDRPSITERLEALQDRGLERGEKREDATPSLSISERLEALRESVEGAREREPSQERETGTEPVRKRSIEERIADLYASMDTPEERQRAREREQERDRERDRGGYEL
ncbi:Ti-type conjugative transfer relaxase TraA [Aureimonas sp. AU20]